MKKIFCMFILFMLIGCAAKTHPNVNSVLWVRTAAEYEASGFQAYNAAANIIDTAIRDTRWTAALEQTGHFSDLPPAVIFDIDETVLDTSAYQAGLVSNDTDFQHKTWDQWIAKQTAESIAGAKDFIRFLQSRGVAVIFITNRECAGRPDSMSACPQKGDTLETLKALGITDIDENHVLLKNAFPDWGSEKQGRREFVAEKYRVLMLFGDDLGDFIPDVKKNIPPEKREELALQFSDKWGTRWFILPNPMYGSWQRVLQAPGAEYLKPKKSTQFR